MLNLKRPVAAAVSWFFPGKFILRRLDNKNRNVALTFDDGPHPVNTAKLLDVLKTQGVKATFFFSGSEARKYPEIVERVRSHGQEIGNHSFHHVRLTDIGIKSYRQGVEKTGKLIEKYSGKMPTLFRPPYGEFNLQLIRFIIESNLVYARWTVDSNDSCIKNSEKLIQSVRNTPIGPGDIILFHEDYSTTIVAMPGIIKDLKSRGLRMVSISDLLNEKNQ